MPAFWPRFAGRRRIHRLDEQAADHFQRALDIAHTTCHHADEQDALRGPGHTYLSLATTCVPQLCVRLKQVPLGVPALRWLAGFPAFVGLLPAKTGGVYEAAAVVLPALRG